jgi:hypothetical protein
MKRKSKNGRSNSLRRGLSEHAKSKIKTDEEFYEYIFYHHPCCCAECRRPLNIRFRDRDGKVIARWQYSHNLAKGAYPDLRHHPLNMERLCFKCHQRWENGDRQNMRIFKRVQKKIQKMLTE